MFGLGFRGKDKKRQWAQACTFDNWYSSHDSVVEDSRGESGFNRVPW